MNVFAKLHPIQIHHGKICATVVIPSRANDSLHLRAMIVVMPNVSGYVLADAQYDEWKTARQYRTVYAAP